MNKKFKKMIFIYALCLGMVQVYAEPKWSYQFNQQGAVFLVDENSKLDDSWHFMGFSPLPNANINNIQFLDTSCVSRFSGQHESPALLKLNNQIYAYEQVLNIDEEEVVNLSQLIYRDECSPIFYSKQFVYQLILDGAQKKLVRLNKLSPQGLSIQNFYFLKDHKRVFYKPLSNEPDTSVYQLLDHADSESFEVIDNGEPYYSYYAKDKNHVFYLNFTDDNKRASVIKNADPASFQVLPVGFAKDNKHLFYQGKELGLIDGESFKWVDDSSWLSAGYAEDKNGLYWVSRDKIINLPFDRVSFSVLHEGLAVDKNGVYLDGQLLKDFSLEGIEFIDFRHGDLSTIYIVKNKDGLFGIHHNDKSIMPMQEVEGSYVALSDINSSLNLEDAENEQTSVEEYIPGADIDGVDLESFIFMADAVDLAKDKNHVYFKNYIIEGWDAPSARVADSGFLIDKNQFVFLLSDRLFAGLNKFLSNQYDSFSGKRNSLVLNDVVPFLDNEHHDMTFFDDTGYSKTNKRVFYNGQEVLGAQAKTFYLMTKYPTFMSDGKSIISNGVTWFGTDPKSFREFKTYEMEDGYLKTYYRDRKHLFTKDGEMVAGADPESHTILVQGYSKDKKWVFYEDKMIANADASSFQVVKKEVVIPCLNKNAQSITTYFLGQDKNQLYRNGVALTDKDLLRFDGCENISTEPIADREE